MIPARNGDKISTKDGWLTCPICKRNHRLLRITDATRARGLPVYCRTCHSEVILNIDEGQSVKRQSQWLPGGGVVGSGVFVFTRR